MSVGVVTDSTALLGDLAGQHGIEVVPLDVVLGGVPHRETDVAAADLAAALRSWTPVSTSRPAPATLLAAYERLAAAGCDAVVSVHLSGDVSGTCSSARLAARSSAVPVTVVDSRTLGMALGYSALAAARVAASGGPADDVAAAAAATAARTRGWFVVDTLEHLRRGGRIGAAAALLGGALAVKPLLQIAQGRVEQLERVRTTARALARLGELAVAAAGDGPVDVCVAHLASPERAADLTAELAQRLAAGLEGREVWCGEIGAVLGAHVGPGMLAVCVAPRLL